MHGFVGRHRPEGVEVDVDGQEPQHQRQRGQLGLQAHGHQDHERRAHHVLQHLTHREQSYTQQCSCTRHRLRESSRSSHAFTEERDLNSEGKKAFFLRTVRRSQTCDSKKKKKLYNNILYYILKTKI